MTKTDHVERIIEDVMDSPGGSSFSIIAAYSPELNTVHVAVRCETEADIRRGDFACASIAALVHEMAGKKVNLPDTLLGTIPLPAREVQHAGTADDS